MLLPANVQCTLRATVSFQHIYTCVHKVFHRHPIYNALIRPCDSLSNTFTTSGKPSTWLPLGELAEQGILKYDVHGTEVLNIRHMKTHGDNHVEICTGNSFKRTSTGCTVLSNEFEVFRDDIKRISGISSKCKKSMLCRAR